MPTDDGRAPSGQALVASDEARSDLHPTGFDPSRWRKLKQQCAGLRNLANSMRREGAWLASAMFVTEAAFIIESQACEISELVHDLHRQMNIANHCLNDSDGMAVRAAALNALRACGASEETFAAVASATHAVVTAIATEAGTAETTKIGSVHEGAARRDRPKEGAQ